MDEHERLNSIDDYVLSIIFSKLPLKTLLQFRSVSKLWLSIIDHPFFTTFHLSHQSSPEPCILSLTISHPRHKKTKSFRIVQEKRRALKPSNDPISELPLLDSSITLEGSCDGILCFSDSKKHSYFLSNPCSKEFTATLPHPEPSFPPEDHQVDHQVNHQVHHHHQHVPVRIISGFGYDSVSNKYKVVRMVYEEFESHVSRTKVYTLGTSSWREISEFPPYSVHGKPVYAHGFLHWLVSPFANDEENLEGLIVCFHVGEEKFSYTPHPSFDSEDSTLFGLLELKGKLGIVDLSRGTNIDIWVMKDYEKEKWGMEYRIDIQAPCGRVNNGHIKVVGLWEDGEILLQADEGFFIFNQKTGLRYNHSLGLESDDSVLLHSHNWSLISVNSVF